MMMLCYTTKRGKARIIGKISLVRVLEGGIIMLYTVENEQQVLRTKLYKDTDYISFSVSIDKKKGGVL